MPAWSDSNPAVRGYKTLIGAGSHLKSFILLVMRLAWGLELWQSGYSHLHNVPKMVEQFKNWGVPLPELNVYISGTTEMVGGLLLMLGLATRLIAVPLIFNFLVAYATASKAKLHAFFAGPNRLEGLTDIIDDTAFPFLMVCILLLAFGPGKASIDYFLQQTVFRGNRKTKSDG